IESGCQLIFERDGAERYRSALSIEELQQIDMLSDTVGRDMAGVRLNGHPLASSLTGPTSTLLRLARGHLGLQARAVRAVLFDKTAETNWALGWHQDRTIVVRDRFDVAGFGPWSRKSGLQHVEPPFSFLDRMVTLRAHLDPCDCDNAPLLIAPGSHQEGRVPVEIIEGTISRLGIATCLAATGDVWLYATAILHASNAAIQPKRRRVLQVDFSADELPPPLEWCLV
ncbi:MAG: phytanoyl-CoA dioxygenase family protein, partial [Hyphomicrobiaceae bacterium]